MEALGRGDAVIPVEGFRRETVSERFRGTLWAAGGMHWVAPDRVEIWYRGNEADFAVTADGKALDSFYSLSRLSGIDHYALFLDGTHDVVTVRNHDRGRPPDPADPAGQLCFLHGTVPGTAL